MTPTMKDALGEIGRLHSQYRHELAEVNARRERLLRDVLAVNDEDWDVVSGSLFADRDDVVRVVTSYVLDMEDDWLLILGEEVADPASDRVVSPPELLRALRARFRDAASGLLQERDRLAVFAGAVTGPHDTFVGELQVWLDEVRTQTSPSLGDWKEILQSWRRAYGLSAREAAQFLEVSAPAVVRYEQGTRTPSIPFLSGMAARMGDNRAFMEEDDVRAALRRVQSMLPEGGVDRMIDNMDLAALEQDEGLVILRSELSDRCESLDEVGLRALLALSQNGTALSALTAWAQVPASDPLSPVRQALRAGLGFQRSAS